MVARTGLALDTKAYIFIFYGNQCRYPTSARSAAIRWCVTGAGQRTIIPSWDTTFRNLEFLFFQGDTALAYFCHTSAINMVAVGTVYLLSVDRTALPTEPVTY